jgi:hypothetical protein
MLGLLLAIGLVGASGAAAATPPATPPATTPVAVPGISVFGSHLLNNGSPWIPRGVQIVGLVAPDGSLSGKYVAAHQHYSESELTRAVADGANMVRFQVSEFGLDPEATLYSAAYVREVGNAVETARSLGLQVIISIQAQGPAGENNRCPEPDAGTARVWAGLAAAFAGDHGVMFELYNEPGLGPGPNDWQTWLNGGPVVQASGFSCEAVGMQTLVDLIRGEGATNVIIIPGLGGETTLSGMPAVSDPTDPSNPQLAYGIHYPIPSGGIGVWDTSFGRLSARVPVMITEWDENSTTNCFANAPNQSSLLLDYLAAKQIGIVGFAFDLPGTIITDYATYAPTTFDRFACGVPGGGPGLLLFGEFAALAQADDPSQVSGIPAWVIGAGSLKQLVDIAPAIARHFFDTPRTFVTGASTTSVAQLSAPAAIPTESFASETTLAADVQSGDLRPGTRAVVFDDEHWNKTPLPQQRNPGAYYTQAAAVAHQYGLLLIADPATNLVLARAPSTSASDEYEKFIQLNIAGAAARHADVYEVDARGPDTSGADYASFVEAASAQATAAAPGVELLSSLSSTSPDGQHRSSKTLLNAALATRTLVSGYQLNDLRGGGGCPSCKVSAPQTATAFLRGLRRNGG